MRRRALAAFETIRHAHQGQSAAIVTHGGIVRALLASTLEIPAANIFRLAQDYGARNLIRIAEGVPQVHLLNAV